MKMVKSLILGSAAGLVAMSGAQAADLPVKAKAVEYVRICSLYGAGFYYIPGTDTCIKLGGYLRVDVLANTNSDDTGNVATPGSAKNRFTNAFTWRSREDLSIDTRTATEYGVVRTFADLTFTWTSDNFAGNGTTGRARFTRPSAAARVLLPVPRRTTPTAARSLTVRSASTTPSSSSLASRWVRPSRSSARPGPPIPATTSTVSSAAAARLPASTSSRTLPSSAAACRPRSERRIRQPTIRLASSTSPRPLRPVPASSVALGASDYGGLLYPDVVATLKVDQAWGLVQASVAAHDNNPAYFNNNATTNPRVSSPTNLVAVPRTSGALLASWRCRSRISRRALATRSTSRASTPTVPPGIISRIWRLSTVRPRCSAAPTLPGTHGSVGFGVAPDSVFSLLDGGSQHLITTWGGRGAFNHNWDPYWSTSVYGAYASVHFGGNPSLGPA